MAKISHAQNFVENIQLAKSLLSPSVCVITRACKKDPVLNTNSNWKGVPEKASHF